MAKNTRVWPSMRIIITVVSPTRAPIEMMVANPGLPDRAERLGQRRGDARVWLYLTMPVTTSDTAT